MKVIFESTDLPSEIRDVLANQRITATVTFNVDQILLRDDEYDDRIGGQVLELNVIRRTGGGGLDPVVSHNLRSLAARSQGTMA